MGKGFVSTYAVAQRDAKHPYPAWGLGFLPMTVEGAATWA
jgi:hypothetical protein